MMSTKDVELPAVSVVAQTRPRVGRGPDLPLLVDEGREPLPEDGLDVILSGQESTVGMSDVSRGNCMEPDLLPVVMSTDDVEPLAVPVVALTRSRVEGPLVGARPVNAALDPLEHSVLDVDMNSLWMAPWDAGGTFRIGSRPEVAIRRDRLRCVVQYFGGLARTCVIDTLGCRPPRRNIGGGQEAGLSRTHE